MITILFYKLVGKYQNEIILQIRHEASSTIFSDRRDFKSPSAYFLRGVVKNTVDSIKMFFCPLSRGHL